VRDKGELDRVAGRGVDEPAMAAASRSRVMVEPSVWPRMPSARSATRKDGVPVGTERPWAVKRRTRSQERGRRGSEDLRWRGRRCGGERRRGVGEKVVGRATGGVRGDRRDRAPNWYRRAEPLQPGRLRAPRSRPQQWQHPACPRKRRARCLYFSDGGQCGDRRTARQIVSRAGHSNLVAWPSGQRAGPRRSQVAEVTAAVIEAVVPDVSSSISSCAETREAVRAARRSSTERLSTTGAARGKSEQPHDGVRQARSMAPSPAGATTLQRCRPPRLRTSFDRTRVARQSPLLGGGSRGGVSHGDARCGRRMRRPAPGRLCRGDRRSNRRRGNRSWC